MNTHPTNSASTTKLENPHVRLAKLEHQLLELDEEVAELKETVEELKTRTLEMWEHAQSGPNTTY